MRSRYRCSMCPAIHINSRSWLRSSSTHEPSDPPLRVMFNYRDVHGRQTTETRRVKTVKLTVVIDRLHRTHGRSNTVDSLNLAKGCAPPVDDDDVTDETGTPVMSRTLQKKHPGDRRERRFFKP